MIYWGRIVSALSLRWHKLKELRLYWREMISTQGHLYVTYSIPYCVRDNYNWGDDVNIYLVEKISGKKVIPYQCCLRKQEHYLCIGSILQWHGDADAIVWGAGLREPKPVTQCKCFTAVRGPLTRNELLKQGYVCPPVYGDPALLLPLYYSPSIKKKYHIGVIPHFSEQNLPIIRQLIIKYDVHFIDIRNYCTFEHFIDEIFSCEYILSSSLHGCIVADAYNVPNAWCRFSDYMAEGSGFKFFDYYLSVGKTINGPLDLTDHTTIENAVIYIRDNWKKNNIDLEKLLAACPFKK